MIRGKPPQAGRGEAELLFAFLSWWCAPSTRQLAAWLGVAPSTVSERRARLLGADLLDGPFGGRWGDLEATEDGLDFLHRMIEHDPAFRSWAANADRALVERLANRATRRAHTERDS